MDLTYRVTPAEPRAHTFHVELTLPRPPAGDLILTMPAWIPGSYMVRDFARNILDIAADDSAGPLALSKHDKQTWHLAHNGRAIRVRYRVYGWDLSVRGAHLDDSHAYFNGAALLLRVVGLDCCALCPGASPPTRPDRHRLAGGYQPEAPGRRVPWASAPMAQTTTRT